MTGSDGATAPRHTWQAVAVYELTDEQAERFRQARDGSWTEGPLNPDEITALRVETLLAIDVGCAVCDQTWESCHDQPCRGKPDGHDEHGHPFWS